jgi:hypothetical protein
MHYSRIFVLIILIATISWSCKTDKKQEADTSSMQFNIVAENLDQELFACKSITEVQNFLDKHAYLSKVYFTNAPVEPNQLAGHLFNILQNNAFRPSKISWIH